mgnify:CR=1 FL=1
MVCEQLWDTSQQKLRRYSKKRKKIKKKSESQFLDLKNYITKYCFSACFIYYAHCIRSLFIAFCKKRTSRNFNLRDDTDPIIISRLIKRERKCESHSHDALSIHPGCDVDDRREGCTPSPRFIPTDTFAGEFQGIRRNLRFRTRVVGILQRLKDRAASHRVTPRFNVAFSTRWTSYRVLSFETRIRTRIFLR